jgi:putative peptidoglycan lipid II flippase
VVDSVPPSPPQGHHSSRAVVRQSGLTGIAAGAGLVAGLLLDIGIAFRFGAGASTDAFFVAARIPLGLTAVVMAAANQALVPAFRTSMTTRGDAPTDRLVSMIICAVLLVGAALVALAWAVAWPLMRVTAPGVSAAEVGTAASMVPVIFAIVPLVAVSEVTRAYLNARYAFVAPALMSGVLTGVAAAIVFVGPILGARHTIQLVAFAYLAGALVQVAFMMSMATRRGLRFRPALDTHDSHLRSIGILCIRPVGSACLNPVARLGEQLVVSFLPTGSITILNYGYRQISAIGGTVFFRSVMVALIPRLTDAHNHGVPAEVRRFTNLGVRIMLAASLPLTAFMAVLAQPAVLAVYQRGGFSRTSADILGVVLAVYSASLVGSAVQRALLAPFFARLDTRTPLRNTFYGVAANLVLLPVMVLPFGQQNRYAVVGVAIAYSLSQYVNVGHAWYRVVHTDGPPTRGVGRFALRISLASLLSAGAMLAVVHALNLGPDQSRTALLLLTPVAGIAGLVVLFGALYVLAGREISGWRGLLRRNGSARARVATSPAAQEAESLEPVAPTGAGLS